MQPHIVIRDILNVRNTPSDVQEDSFVGELTRDAVVWLHDQEIAGTVPRGGRSDKWKVDHNNRFVHTEGVRLLSWEEKKQIIFSAIRKSWALNSGPGPVVALLDTGVVSQHDFLPPVASHFQVINGQIQTSANPVIQDMHGTRMAGFVCGRENGNEIVGISPTSSVVDYQIVHKPSLNLLLNMEAALAKIILEPSIRIINMSFELPDVLLNLTPDLLVRVNQLINEGISNGKIFVAATGDQICDTNQNVQFPGKNEQVITVGVLRGGIPVNFSGCQLPLQISRTPDCFIELDSWTICHDNPSIQIHSLSDSSEAAAMMSALIALKITGRPQLTHHDVKEHVSRSSVPLNDFSGLTVSVLNIPDFLTD